MCLVGVSRSESRLRNSEDPGNIIHADFKPLVNATAIALKGDPPKDISELSRVSFVMKDGRVVKG
jgi:hypothetical protein